MIARPASETLFAADAPTLDDYFTAATRLATLVRRAFDGRVKRAELLEALEQFERVDFESQ